MSFEKKLEELGIVVPECPKSQAAYEPGVLVGDLIYVSGQLPMVNGELQHKGVVGVDVTPEDAKVAAKYCAINALGVIKSICGSLDNVVKIVQIQGFVNSNNDFGGQPVVINGASEFIKEVFGEVGAHSRFAIGNCGLPLNSSVEVGMIVQIKK